MEIVIYTHKGKKRKTNQDAVLYKKIYQENMEKPLFFQDENTDKIVVADGIGGLASGEIASKTVLEVVKDSNLPIKETLKQAKDKLIEIDKAKEMGTVLAGISMKNKTIFNVGDSRVYKVVGDYLFKLSNDHSLGNNIVTSAITSRTENPEIYQKEIEIRKGDTFLLCTDGVWGQISEDELDKSIRKNIQEFAEKLLNALWQKELSDNLSFAIVKV